MKIFIYIIQPLTLRRADIYKIGQSVDPIKRSRQLGGSGSTETFSLLYMCPLPRGISDTDILRHEYIRPYVIHKNLHLVSKCTKIIGVEHKDGLNRRKELLHFEKMSHYCIISLLLSTMTNIENSIYYKNIYN